MGLLNGMMNKLGKKIEESAAPKLSGASKELYEKEQTAKKSLPENKSEDLSLHTIAATAQDLKDLESLLLKIKVVDSNKVWLGGLDNFKVNQNAKFANMFSGNQNIKTISANGNDFYLSKFEKDKFYAYSAFTKADVSGFELKGLITKKLNIKLKNGKIFTIDITKNKEKMDEIKQLLSK